MRNRTLWLAFALMGALVLMGAPAMAQPPDRQGRPPRGAGGRGGFPPGLTVDQIVERIMAFDQNKDGKVTKDELPERMQDLITRGDTNKDGALDKEEIRKLAAEIARDEALLGRGPRGRGGPGGRGGPRGRGGPDGGFFPGPDGLGGPQGRGG